MSKPFHILIVDDEQVIIDSVIKLCSGEGFLVDSASSAQEALRKIENHPYKIIICDIMMPEMDGFQFLEICREKKISGPVIMTTGYSTVENAVKSLYSGAIDFIPKPFSFEELISSVQRGLELAEILKTLETGKKPELNSSIVYVPCPASYLQLGYCSWMVNETDGTIKIGITDLFLKTINSIEKFNLANVEEEIIQGNCCFQIETDDGLIHNVLSPLTGRIIERNENILAQKEIVEKDPYFNGWVYTIIASDLEYETKHLIPCSSDRTL